MPESNGLKNFTFPMSDFVEINSLLRDEGGIQVYLYLPQSLVVFEPRLDEGQKNRDGFKSSTDTHTWLGWTRNPDRLFFSSGDGEVYDYSEVVAMYKDFRLDSDE